jgi:hypothetical protein
VTATRSSVSLQREVLLLLYSRTPRAAAPLVWAVIGIEVARGIVYDAYMLAQGYALAVYAPWIVIHSIVITTGVLVLRRSGDARA